MLSRSQATRGIEELLTSGGLLVISSASSLENLKKLRADPTPGWGLGFLCNGLAIIEKGCEMPGEALQEPELTGITGMMIVIRKMLHIERVDTAGHGEQIRGWEEEEKVKVREFGEFLGATSPRLACACENDFTEIWNCFGSLEFAFRELPEFREIGTRLAPCTLSSMISPNSTEPLVFPRLNLT